MSTSLRPVVFLDRDGTLNVEAGYIHDLNNLNLIDGAAEAVSKLNSAGIACILITNQSGAARGYYEEEHIRNLNARLVRLLQDHGAYLDDVYYCPHLPDGTVPQYTMTCQCRKPAPGLVEEAYKKHSDLDRNNSFVVGDKATDVELASNCGAKSILVETGYGKQVISGEYQWKVTPDFQTDCITTAVDWILDQVQARKSS